MNRIFKYIIPLIISFNMISSQEFTIEDFQEKARINYPLIRQYGLIEQTEELTVSNAWKNYLPKLIISGKASYQSDVTHLPLKIPGSTLTPPDKDQYQITAEISQTIWDGGTTGAEAGIAEASSLVEQKKMDVEMYSLRERINQLCFGILLIDERLKQNELISAELESLLSKITSLAENGLTAKADIAKVKVEVLLVKQKHDELKTQKEVYAEMLFAFSGEKYKEGLKIKMPEIPQVYGYTEGLRPESSLFSVQSDYFESMKSSINSAVIPKINLFLQAGYGKPGLNMLENKFAAYYVGGIRFSWNLTPLYSLSNNLELIEINRQTSEVRNKAFLFNNGLQASKQIAEINNYKKVLSYDDDIIKLRSGIREATEAKLENGTADATDLLREMNAESSAKLEKALHRIQLLAGIYNLKYLSNNE